MKNSWQKIIISQQATIRDALKVIDSQALGIALIADNNKLLGTLTDGDIRRGLLRSLNMDDAAVEVMNSNPIVVGPETEKEQLIHLMESKSIFALPVVKNGVIEGIYTLHELLHKPQYENPIFLMAGGFGTRLRPLTDDCPKPLLKVGNKPILEITLQRFIDAGFKNFYISTHYLPKMIQAHFGDGSNWGVKIQYVHEENPLGTGGALGLLPKEIPQLPLIMINGDILTNMDFSKLLEFHNKENADATMCVREYDYQIPYGVIYGEGHRITSMIEKPIQRFHINAGIYVVNPEVYNSVDKDTAIDMPTLLENKIAKNKSVLMFPLHEYWLDIGQMDDYRRAQQDIISLELE